MNQGVWDNTLITSRKYGFLEHGRAEARHTPFQGRQAVTRRHLPRHNPKSKAICLCVPMSYGPARARLPEGRALYKGIMCFTWRPSPQPQAQMEAVSCYNEFVMLLRLFPLCACWPFKTVWIHWRTVIGLLLASVGVHARCVPHPRQTAAPPLKWP